MSARADVDLGWRFGIGQTSREETAEILRAQVLGQTDRYMVAQAAARKAERDGTGTRTLSSSLVTRTPAKNSARKSKPARHDPSPAKTPAALDDLAGLDALLACHELGTLDPLPVRLPQLPEDAPPLAHRVADDMALLFGLRLAAFEDRPAPISARWHARRLSIDRQTANRAHRYLIRVGVLVDAGAMPGRGGQRGTRLYALGGDQGSYKPTAGLERVTVAWVSPGLGTGPPSSQMLLERALRDAEPGRRNEFGVWLAAQLRDSGVPFVEALDVMFDYAARVPAGSHAYTARAAANTLKSVYRRPARRPWGVRGTGGTP